MCSERSPHLASSRDRPEDEKIPRLTEAVEDDSTHEEAHILSSSGMFESDNKRGVDVEWAPPHYSPPSYNEEELASTAAITYSLPINSSPIPRLRCPVVIPQRRPGSKGRGFM